MDGSKRLYYLVVKISMKIAVNYKYAELYIKDINQMKNPLQLQGILFGKLQLQSIEIFAEDTA